MWIWWGKEEVNQNHITLERGRWFSWDFGFHLEVDMEDITLGLYTGLCDFYISLDYKPVVRFLGEHPNYHFKHTMPDGTIKKGSYWQERNIGIRLDLRSMTFSGEWWVDMNDQPRKRHFYWFLWDKILGRDKYTEKVLQEGGVDIDMPEGVYHATFKRFISYWKRPRSPFTRSMHRISMDIPVGIPHEGKGENSWDMGMDATFGVTMPAEENESIYDIAKRFAISCLKTRQKYGSLHSPDYAKWKLEGEVRVEQKEQLKKNDEDILNVAGVPDELMPKSPVNSSASETKMVKEAQDVK